MLITIQVKNRLRGRAVQEMNSSAQPLALDKKSAHTVTRYSHQVIITAAQREADQLNQSLVATCQVTPQTQQPLAMLAKGVQSNGDGPAIGP
jgi:hypothetical protein